MTEAGSAKRRVRPEDAEVGARLRAIREKRELRQVDLARAMQKYGWRQATVWEVEKGQRSVRFPEAVELARVLAVTLDELARGPLIGLAATLEADLLRATSEELRHRTLVWDLRLQLAALQALQEAREGTTPAPIVEEPGHLPRALGCAILGWDWYPITAVFRDLGLSEDDASRLAELHDLAVERELAESPPVPGSTSAAEHLGKHALERLAKAIPALRPWLDAVQTATTPSTPWGPPTRESDR